MHPKPGLVAFFAYGAKMRLRAMEEAGTAPEARETARLDAWALTFDLRGIPVVEPAFASIEPRPESVVHGVLWWVTPDEARRVDRFESARYDVVDVEVVAEVSGRVRARAYKNRTPVPGLAPSRRYLRLIAEGAREAGLPEAYVRELEQVRSAYVPVLSEVATAGWLMFLAAQRWRPRRD
jgi:hypothetical protein